MIVCTFATNLRENQNIHQRSKIAFGRIFGALAAENKILEIKIYFYISKSRQHLRHTPTSLLKQTEKTKLFCA